MNRKKFLTICVLLTLVIGILFSTYPFLMSLKPAASNYRGVTIDLEEIEEGERKLFEFDGVPVIVYKPSIKDIEYLVLINDLTNGPNYSIENVQDFYIYRPLSTHRGCMLLDAGDDGGRHEFYKHVGWYDPCHRGFWDYSGRLIPSLHNGIGLSNLTEVKNFEYVSDTVIRLIKK